jgi:hypothetical protein
MSRLAEDIDYLQRAADAACIVIYPGDNSATFPDAARVNVPIDTLSAYAEGLQERRLSPREYDLIGYEAVWLLQVARQLKLYREDGDQVKSERFQKFGEYLRAAVEIDLVNARKSLERL